MTFSSSAPGPEGTKNPIGPFEENHGQNRHQENPDHQAHDRHDTTKANAIIQDQQAAYLRVSSDQNTVRQLGGMAFDRAFTATFGGKNTVQPAFTEMLRFVRAGDTVRVRRMGRLAHGFGISRETV